MVVGVVAAGRCCRCLLHRLSICGSLTVLRFVYCGPDQPASRSRTQARQALRASVPRTGGLRGTLDARNATGAACRSASFGVHNLSSRHPATRRDPDPRARRHDRGRCGSGCADWHDPYLPARTTRRMSSPANCSQSRRTRLRRSAPLAWDVTVSAPPRLEDYLTANSANRLPSVPVGRSMLHEPCSRGN